MHRYLKSRHFISPKKQTEREFVENSLRSLRQHLVQRQRRIDEKNNFFQRLELSQVLRESLVIDSPAQEVLQLIFIKKENKKTMRMRLHEAMLQHQIAKIEALRMQLMPDLSVKGFFNSAPGNPEERIWGAGVSLPLPLWHPDAAEFRLEKKRLQIMKMQLNLEKSQEDKRIDLLTKQIQYYQTEL